MTTQYVWVFVDKSTEEPLFAWDGRLHGYKSRKLAREAKKLGDVDTSAKLVKVPASQV